MYLAPAQPDGKQPVGELLGQRPLRRRPQLLQCRRVQVGVGPQRQRGDVLGPEAYGCTVIQHHPLVTQPALRRADAHDPHMRYALPFAGSLAGGASRTSAGAAGAGLTRPKRAPPPRALSPATPRLASTK